MCDRMRGDAFGAAGNPNANTPNIDKLAANGVMFRNNFVNNPYAFPPEYPCSVVYFPARRGFCIINIKENG